MRLSDSCARMRVPFVCVITMWFLLVLFEGFAFSITVSVGRPYQGRLVNGIPFPDQFQGYSLRDPERSYTTPEVIGALLDAFDAVRERYPETCNLFVGDFSRAGGGWLNMHRSHQNGRDVDLGMYARDNRILDTFVPMNSENIDIPKTWCLIEHVLRSQHVQYIFLDRRIQELLHDYALSSGGNPAYLEALFGNNRGAIMQHVRGHYDHIHIRFYTPWSTMAARVGDGDDQKLAAIEMAQQAYLPKQVNYYVKGNEPGLQGLAQSFGVKQEDLCRWNRIGSNDTPAPGACMVFYKRSFEVEPVRLARSLQPDSVPDSPGTQLASSIVAEARSDAVVPGQRIRLTRSGSDYGDIASSGASKSVPAVSVANPKTSGVGVIPAVYTAGRNDTLAKIAKQQGLNLDALCRINGLSKNSTIKAGQKIQLCLQNAPQRNTTSSKATRSSLKSKSKRSVSRPSTLQANMKPVPNTKAKSVVLSKQNSLSIQKTSAKSVNKTSTAKPAKPTADKGKRRLSGK